MSAFVSLHPSTLLRELEVKLEDGIRMEVHGKTCLRLSGAKDAERGPQQRRKSKGEDLVDVTPQPAILNYGSFMARKYDILVSPHPSLCKFGIVSSPVILPATEWNGLTLSLSLFGDAALATVLRSLPWEVELRLVD